MKAIPEFIRISPNEPFFIQSTPDFINGFDDDDDEGGVAGVREMTENSIDAVTQPNVLNYIAHCIKTITNTLAVSLSEGNSPKNFSDVEIEFGLDVKIGGTIVVVTTEAAATFKVKAKVILNETPR